MRAGGHGARAPVRTIATWTVVVAAVVVLSVVLTFAGLRAAPLFAALAIGLVVALVRRGAALHLPGAVATSGQALLGVLIGGLAQPSTLSALGRGWRPAAPRG